MGVIYQYNQQYTSPTNVLDFYPVGSVYETTNSSFNPNNTWGGNWTLETIANDEIIEEGTSGIWTYRKWKSGIAECWGTWSGTLSHYSTYSSFYGYYTSVTFPSSLFSAAPVVTFGGRVSSNGWALTGTQTVSLTKDSTNFYLLSSTSGSITVNFLAQVKGIWKTYTTPTTIYRWHRTA